MAKTNYDSASPYYETPQASWYLAPIKLRVIAPDSTDRLIILDAKYQYRPDLLAYDLYGNPALYWVFMVRNMDVIRDPIWEFEAGIQIYVPNVNRVTALFG